MDSGTGLNVEDYEKSLVPFLVDKVLLFCDLLSKHPLRPYQRPFAARLVESVLLEDAADITALFARQAGKSETVCNIVAALMVLLPRLAKIYPQHERLAKFSGGLQVGIFAPVADQAETLFGRLVDRLTSDEAFEILQDPEIDDKAVGKSGQIELTKCRSRAVMMTANPRAKIESKTFHIAVIDEAQDCDDYVIRKSVMPMLSSTAGTSVRTGTPNQRKGDFYSAIQQNKRQYANVKGSKKNHFEADWKEVAKYLPRYKKAVLKDMERMGEDSDEFNMSYCLKWILERGMLATESKFNELSDISMQDLVKEWTSTPVTVGIDPAGSGDSTVVTVCFVDWDRPDQFGFYTHRVLNWLDLQTADYESQYYEICRFLDPYNIYAVGVDSNGLGGPMAHRLGILLRPKNCEVIPMPSDVTNQTKRWKHLITLMDRGLIGWPAGARVRRLRTWRKFQDQMLSAEKNFKGPNIQVGAPDSANAHDDYVDSLALATYCTADVSVPTLEVHDNFFYSKRRR